MASRIFLASFLISMIAYSTDVFAGFFETGNSLYSDCEGEDFKKFKCFGYVVGAYDMHAFMAAAIKRSGGKQVICGPDGLTVGQMRDVVVKYLKDNPDKRHHPASILAFAAFADAWPCPNN
ncbi:MAG TPA: hypothetical protein DCG48_04415 [Rhodospirillaceae bacterium]|nr:hypothetical protein [Rhodospirillaceae bacterium]|tara:strand:- start:14768 stop:15130 length:363 start_codon:yes stop_codon:yes gene_type:complete